MDEMGRKLGVTGIRPDEAGVYQLDIDGMIIVNVYHHIPRDKVIFFTNIWHIEDPAKKHEVYETVLVGNLFGLGTNGSILGLDVDQDMVILTHHEDMDMLDAFGFEHVLKGVCETAAKWIKKLYELTHGELEGTGGEDEGPNALPPPDDSAIKV